MLDGGERGRPGSAVVSGDLDHVGVSLGDARGDGADPLAAHELDRYSGAGIDALEVEDQLGEVFDGVDVVVGWGGDQRHTGRAVAQGGDLGGDLVTGELSSLASGAVDSSDDEDFLDLLVDTLDGEFDPALLIGVGV